MVRRTFLNDGSRNTRKARDRLHIIESCAPGEGRTRRPTRASNALVCWRKELGALQSSQRAPLGGRQAAHRRPLRRPLLARKAAGRRRPPRPCRRGRLEKKDQGVSAAEK